jgi:hypothetical protein
MLIANPIYDTVFKYLMEDQASAKIFLSTIIGEEIEELLFTPRERTGQVASLGVTIFRLDFSAVILTKEGIRRNVLIELQKSNSGFDIRRFRRYLAENYHEPNPSIVQGKSKEDRERENPVLPILSIYLLGFPLKELIGRSALRIRRQYEDAVTGEILNVRDDFVEKLSHDCYVLQLSEIHQRRRSKLERLLAIFEQLNLEVNQHLKEFADQLPEEFSVIVERLQHAALDETLLKEIELEKEFMNSWLDQEKALKESKQREEEERRKKEEERRQKEELLASRKSTYEQLIKSGMPKEEVLKILNLKEAP